MTLFEAVIEGLTATVIGMGMVFGVLAILCVVLYFFKYLTPKEKKPEQAPEPSVEEADAVIADEPAEVYDDTELIAVISAALAAYAGEGSPAMAIKSITPVGRGTYRAWNVAAIRENHRGLY